MDAINPIVKRWQQRGQSDPDGLWAEAAEQLPWFRRWDRVLDWDPSSTTFRWFVGGSTNPPPVPEEEVKRIAVQLQEGSARPKAKVAFEVGEQVKVIDGPFADFSGVVEEVRADKGTLKVAITIFGRSTSVEMELVQVEKM